MVQAHVGPQIENEALTIDFVSACFFAGAHYIPILLLIWRILLKK